MSCVNCKFLDGCNIRFSKLPEYEICERFETKDGKMTRYKRFVEDSTITEIADRLLQIESDEEHGQYHFNGKNYIDYTEAIQDVMDWLLEIE